MRRGREIDSEDFEALLTWLDSNRERAGAKYEQIRVRLVRVFMLRGCLDAEDLADETINRVTLKARELISSFDGDDPAVYFYGVARLVHLESLRSSKRKEDKLKSLQNELKRENISETSENECLERCLDKLPPAEKELLLNYFEEEKQDKINNRKLLAGNLKITLNVLRVRISRLKNGLQECVEKCLEEN